MLLRAACLGIATLLSLPLTLAAYAGYDVDVGELKVGFVTADDRPAPEASLSIYVGTFVEVLHWPLYAAEVPPDSEGVAAAGSYSQGSGRERYHGSEMRLGLSGWYVPACSGVVNHLTGVDAEWQDPAEVARVGLSPGSGCTAVSGSMSEDRLRVSAARMTCRLNVSRAALDGSLRAAAARCLSPSS